ncbi:MAG: GIY-YIG nuclease family protein [Bacteroidia bacterium]|nr:GIY-YIG nuclease family protein [Bacteroidia bacterium]
MAFYTYVLKSLKDGTFYKGHCQDLEKRLKQHNDGETISIKSKTPFIIIYHEEFDTREEAISREKYFKSASGRRFIKTKIAE